MGTYTISGKNPVKVLRALQVEQDSDSIVNQNSDLQTTFSNDDLEIPKPPEFNNDVNMTITFLSSALLDCVINSRATFNVDIKLELLKQYVPELLDVFNETISQFIHPGQSILENGFLPVFFYDVLDEIFEEAVRVVPNTLLAYTEIYRKYITKTPVFRIAAYKNNSNDVIGLGVLEKNQNPNYLFANLTISIKGKDGLNAASLGLTANEAFRMFFFNSEKFQLITPTFGSGNAVFQSLSLTEVTAVSLGKNQIKI